MKRFLRKLRIHKSDSSDTSPKNSDAERESAIQKSKQNESFFCSELVAAALQTMHLLPPDLNVSAIWPGSFVLGGDIDTFIIENARYSK